ncbi:MAG TPA: glycosyltransferase [Candidatus Mediterraneibacter pullistercoris]|nr:glycosyltransferase [Candidatus Mediterraneibacter pullistercoris]
MVQAPEVSIITPIYNGEKYLKECIDSILNQTFADFELICVDDGSTDHTNEILDEYKTKDHRVRVYHQKNQYAGVARNTGMDHAEGKYILFLDSDDFFQPDMVEKLYEQIEKDKADICVCAGYQYDDKNKISIAENGYLNHKLVPEVIPFSVREAEEVIFNFTTMHLYNKMFRFDFIKENGIRFKPYRLGEDAGFVLHALALAKSITIVDEKLFHYRINTGISVTDSAPGNIMAGYNTLLEARSELIERGVYTEKLQKSFANKALGNCMYFFKKASTFEAYCRLYENLVNGGFKDLDIVDHGKEYFYVEKNYKNFLKMMECKDPFRYLFGQYVDLKAVNYSQSVQIKKNKKELKKVKQELKRIKEELKEKDRRIKEIRNSETYLIGKALLWLPRKILGK